MRRSAHPIGDSDEYLEDAELGECACPCAGEEFEVTAGVSLYDGSEDVKWLYLGCRCLKCGLVGHLRRVKPLAINRFFLSSRSLRPMDRGPEWPRAKQTTH